MKNGVRIQIVIFALAAAAICAHAVRVVAQAGQSAIAGVWRLQQNGLPSVTLNISYESGTLNGAILFYLLRKEPGKTETSTAGIPEPLIDPKFDARR